MTRQKRQDFQVPIGRLENAGGGKTFAMLHASEGKGATSHVRSQVQLPLAASQLDLG